MEPLEELALKVLIADDHALVRAGLAEALAHLAGSPALLEAADAREVLATVGANPDLDLILLDLLMPGANGFELLSRVCGVVGETPVVVLSASEDTDHMRKALDCGAAGYIPKAAAAEVMLSALHLVLAGGIYVPPDLVHAPPAGQANLTGPAIADHAAGLDALTPRQCEVLRLIGQGRSNKQVARDLDLSQNTVKIHVAAILRAFGAANRTEAVMRARELGFDFHRP